MERVATLGKIKDLSSRVSKASGVVKKIASATLKILTFSPANSLSATSNAVNIRICSRHIEAISASSHFNKIKVQARKNYKYAEDPMVPHLESSGSMPTPSEVTSAIALALKDLKVREKQQQINLIVPKRLVVLNTTTFPNVVRDNLDEVVRFEFDRFTPFTVDEAIYDYTYEPTQDGRISVSIASAKSSLLTECISLLSERNVNVKSIFLDVSCMATLCSYITKKPSFIFAEIKRQGITTGLVRNGRLKSTLSKDFTGQDQDYIAQSVEDAIIYQLDNGASDRKPHAVSSDEAVSVKSACSESGTVFILVSKELSSLTDLLASRGNFKFEIINNFDKQIAGSKDMTAADAVVLGGVLESLWPNAQKFDLLLKGIKKKVKIPYVMTAILGVLLMAGISVYEFAPISAESDRLAEINRQINIRKPEVKNVEKIKEDIDKVTKRIELIEQFKHEKPYYVVLLKELTVLIPKNAWLTRVRMSDNQVNIEGYAPAATSLVQILESSKFFEKVEFASPTFRDPKQNMDRFQIKMAIRTVTPKQAEAKAENEKK